MSRMLLTVRCLLSPAPGGLAVFFYQPFLSLGGTICAERTAIVKAVVRLLNHIANAY